MATLIVRKLDDDLVQRLKARARAHGRSAEAEHRLILQEALSPKPKMTGAEFWEGLRGTGPFFDRGHGVDARSSQSRRPRPVTSIDSPQLSVPALGACFL